MKKLFIETYGCQMNVADSEVVASVMQMAGYEICEKEEEADAIFLNTCSIRENAENKIYHRLDTLHAEQKKGRKVILGVLGCMAERVKDDLIQNHYANLVCGPDSYLNLPDMIAQCEMGTNAINIELSKTETYRDIVPQRIGGNRVSGFVSIMRGCNNFCHYCIVPYTRGRERSRDAESILREVRDLQQRGFKEVTLLGQNVNSYGLSPSGKREEGSFSFAELLHMVAQAVPDMRVRFTTSNPEDMTEDILHAIAEEPNLCKHIHFPAQSGSNKILKLMKRFQKQDAIVIYVPDHGEECYEENRGFICRNHSAEIDWPLAHYEFEIPFWIYCSPKYIRNHRDIYRQIRKAKDKRFMTDALPHLLLYLAGIETPTYKEEYNILSPKYDEMRPRILKNSADYDKLRDAHLEKIKKEESKKVKKKERRN